MLFSFCIFSTSFLVFSIWHLFRFSSRSGKSHTSPLHGFVWGSICITLYTGLPVCWSTHMQEMYLVHTKEMLWLICYFTKSMFRSFSKTRFESNSNPNKNNKVNLVEKLLKQRDISAFEKTILPCYKKLKQMFEQQLEN